MADKKWSEMTKITPVDPDAVDVMVLSGAGDTPASDNVRVAGSTWATGAQGDKADTAVQSVNGETGTSVTLDTDNISDAAQTNKYTSQAEIDKLAGIESGAEVNNISDANATDLTDGGETTLHTHPGGAGNVVGPAGATDEAIARYNTTTGELIQDSGITIADGASGTLSGTNTGDDPGYDTVADAGGDQIKRDTILFTGAGVTVSDTGTQTEVVIPGGGANLSVEDEGVVIDAATTSMDFVGDGVEVTSTAAGAVEVSIPSGADIAFPLNNTKIIFAVFTGQSNMQCIEPQDGAGTVSGFTINPKVFSYCTDGKTDTGVNTGQPVLPSDPVFSWRNDIDLNENLGFNPTGSILNAPGDYYPFEPYVGPLRGGRGDHSISWAHEVQRLNPTYDVYVISITQSAADLEWWTPGFVNPSPGANTSVYDRLSTFVPYILANGPLQVAGITAPDVYVWGQSEANAYIDTGTSKYLTPEEYYDQWQTIRESSNISDNPTTGWTQIGHTQTFLVEPTQWVNWIVAPGNNYENGTTDSAWQWEGLEYVDRSTDESVRFVSSEEIEYDGVREPNGLRTNQIHFTGSGNMQYGVNTARAALRVTPAETFHSTKLQRELSPTLNNADTATGLDANFMEIFNVGTLTTENMVVSGVSTGTGAVTTRKVTMTGELITPLERSQGQINCTGTQTVSNGGQSISYNPMRLSTTFECVDTPFNNDAIRSLYLDIVITNGETGAGFDVGHFPTVQALNMVPSFRVDTHTVDIGAMYGVYQQPDVSGDGTLNFTGGFLGSSYQGYMATSIWGPNTVIPVEVGFAAYGAVVTLTDAAIETQIAYFAGTTVKGTKSNFNFLASVENRSFYGPGQDGNALPDVTGSWNMYQMDTHNNHWGGGHQQPYAATSGGATLVLDGTHHFVEVTTGTGNQITLPLSTDLPNQEYYLRNTSASPVTINHATDTLVGFTNSLAADTVVHIINDGAGRWISFT